MKTTTRRSILRTAALGVTTAIAAPYVRGAHAAGKLSVGFWDHWVPGHNDRLAKLCNEWATTEKVDLHIDFITSQGNKDRLTVAAEAQARSGHDILTFPAWGASGHAALLEPVDDVMKQVIANNGKTNPVVEYLARQEGQWIAVPATSGSALQVPCSRLDMLKQYAGIDLVAMYPPDGPTNAELAKTWTLDTFLAAAEKCAKAGHPFGIGLGTTNDSMCFAGVIFRSFGAQLVDDKGEITVKSESTLSALDYMRRLAAFLPPDVIAWDNSSNNRWLISGKGALICNPPSAWAVAKRDAPQVAEQCWTHPMPAGPEGRFAAYSPSNWGVWSFSTNKAAAKSLLAHLSTREAVRQIVEAGQGYDIPGYEAFHDFPTWAEQGPPKGTLRHYPVVPGEQVPSVAAWPAPPRIAMQIFNQAIMTKMVAGMVQNGDTPEKAIAWAESELAGFLRT